MDHWALTMPSMTPAKRMPEALMTELSFICAYCPKTEITSLVTRFQLHELDVRFALLVGIGIGEHQDGISPFPFDLSLVIVIAEDAKHVLEDADNRIIRF